MKNKKKIFVSCGEMSGDLHLSYIIEEMKIGRASCRERV